ncbi:MAG: serine--tRNA ligase, partial [Acetobacteraceae bacterium]|nr:serine--tRNA ligase [Acetobacteraceae bacterium]
MHDIRTVRADPAAFDAALARRGVEPQAATLLDLDLARRNAISAVEQARAERRQRSKEIGAAKAAGDHEKAELLIAALDARDSVADEEARTAEAALTALLEALPNLLDPDVPDGADESANVVLHQHGTPPTLPFDPKQHFELGEALGMMDFAAAARLAGARFTVLKGPLARLERALGQWMITLHTAEHGYTEISPPLLVNDATLYGTAQLPKFHDQQFRTTDGRWLIP